MRNVGLKESEKESYERLIKICVKIQELREELDAYASTLGKEAEKLAEKFYGCRYSAGVNGKKICSIKKTNGLPYGDCNDECPRKD